MNGNYEFIEVARTSHIATVWLNRPESANAMHGGIMAEIEDVATSFLNQEEIRVVLFRGRGSNFSAGADLKHRGPKARAIVQHRRDMALGARMIRAITEINQVTIAVVQGAAAGGGACIAAACDFRIGTPNTRCGYPESRLGVSLMWRSLPILVRLVGPARAKRMLMLGKLESARDLEAWGYLDSVVGEEELEENVASMAREFADQPPIPVQMIKASVNAVSSALDQAVMHMDTDQYLLTSTTDDSKEGFSAARDRRTAQFKGK